MSNREIISFYLTEVPLLLKSNPIVFTQWFVQIVLTFFHQKSELMYKCNKYILVFLRIHNNIMSNKLTILNKNRNFNFYFSCFYL